MKLTEFIALKPAHIRLGQWFVLNYCKPVGNHWPVEVDKLWNLDGNAAGVRIRSLMAWWQWDELPDILKQGEQK